MRRALPFTMEEYKSRLDRVRVQMATRKLDTLLLLSPVSTNYLTGYETVSVTGYQCLAIPLQGEPAIMVWELELPGVYYSSWLADGVTYCFGEDVAVVTRNMLEQRAWLKGTIGIERDSAHVSACTVERLCQALAGVNVLDCSDILTSLLRIKSPAEIACIRKASTFTSAAMHAAIDAIAVGVTDNEVAAAAHAAAIQAGADLFADQPIVTTGARTGIAHTTHQRQVIGPDDPVWLEIGAAYEHYSAPLMRTVFVGQVPDEVQRLADASLASLEAVLVTMKAGVPAREVAKAGAAPLPLYDPTIGFHQTYGYSIGLGFPPTWSDDPAFKINLASDFDLQAGMVLHVTMGLRRNGKYGAVCSETVAITNAGCEVLTTFPRQYFYK